MKKIILIVTILTGSLFSNAQVATTGAKPLPDAATRAKSMTERMNSVVTLTEDQKTKVMAINLEKAKSIDLNHQKSGDNTEMFEKERQLIITKWNTDLKAAFTQEQMTKWRQYVADQQKNKTQSQE